MATRGQAEEKGFPAQLAVVVLSLLRLEGGIVPVKLAIISMNKFVKASGRGFSG